MAMTKNFRIFHKLEPPYSIIMENRNHEDSIMFESNAVAMLSAAETDTIKKQYSKVLDAYGCLGVLSLGVGEETALYLVLVTGCLSVGKICESEIFRITSTHFQSLRNMQGDEDRVGEVRKLLNSGTYYFAWSSTGVTWDLTLCAQKKLQDHETDNRFFWNRMLHVHFQRFGIDCEQWLFKMICGGVEIRTIYAAHRQAKACLISRLSCERAGTRFNVRGTNDDGHVANFVETEQVIFLDDQISSYIQTRGSVPLFWEQPGIQVGSHRVRMSRGHESSAPAFERHLAMLKEIYGDQVLINLLGRKEGEHMLSQAFQNHHKMSMYHLSMPLQVFDYHTECRGGNTKNLEKLKQRVTRQLNEFEFFYSREGQGIKYQTGTLRTNCLDCLDRTNAVQSMFGLEVLPKQLDSLGLANKQQMITRFMDIYRQIWSANGDHVSRIYAGTGALGGGRSKYSDAARSASRTIQNNFLDSSKQEAIDVLLIGSTLRGELADKARALLTTRSLHAPAPILNSMVTSNTKYTETCPLRIFVGTWNVNGGKHFRSIAFKHESMSDWLLDAPKIFAEKCPDQIDRKQDWKYPIDIYAIGFEEIVDLSASNIMKASTEFPLSRLVEDQLYCINSTTNSREWQKELIKTISREHKYIVLTSVQLVGVILYVFIRPHLAPFVRDVATDFVKTGLGGTTGNKGAVAIRFLYHSTSICFVCAHFAAGQSQVSDRNNDYHEINKKISFPMGKTIQSHDYVFWCGDFNYRIDLPNEEVKSLIEDENWGALQACDQLTQQRENGSVFRNYCEGKPDFAPTYKYDLFCNDYDTSEKNRTPSWTDRVLWRRKPVIKHEPQLLEQQEWNPGNLLLYTRSELKTSDHRPVVAILDVDVVRVNEDKKEKVFQEVISQQGPPDGTVIVSMETGEFDDEMIDSIVETFSDIGDIILVRFVGEDMWLIFQTGQYALQALKYDKTQVNDKTIRVHLKTEKWEKQIQKELTLCAVTTNPLYNSISNTLLGDDFTIPTMEFDSEEDEDLDPLDEVLPDPLRPTKSGSNTPTTDSGRNSPVGSDDGLLDVPPHSRPVPPGRPRPPSPLVNKKSAEKATELITPEVVPKLRGAPEAAKRVPPQRPTAPPVKPPPPQRPQGGPSQPSSSTSAPSSTVQSANTSEKAQTEPRRTPGLVRKPLSSQSIKKIKSSKQSKIHDISVPTNVTHHGHATSIADAQKLIEQLMTSQQSGLQTPLVPESDGSMKRSKSATLLEETDEKENESLSAPKPVPRFRSSGNIVGIANDDGPARPSRSRDSEIHGEDKPQPRPRPAPRRDIQDETTDRAGTNDTTKEGTQNSWNRTARGMPPPVPPAKPSIGKLKSREDQNISDTTVTDIYAKPNKFNKVTDIYAKVDKSSSPKQNILDAPLSPGHSGVTEPDPFDTSSVPLQFISRGPPPVPQRQLDLTGTKAEFSSDNWHSDRSGSPQGRYQIDDEDASPPSPNFSPPDVPPPFFDGTENSSGFSPPKGPPPTLPPESIAFCNSTYGEVMVTDESTDFDLSPPKHMPPPPPRETDGTKPLPVVPARSTEPHEQPIKNLPTVPARRIIPSTNGCPPVPSRPANLPPVPPRK